MSGVFDLDADGATALEQEARLNPFDPKDLPLPLFAGSGESLKGLLRPSAGTGRALMVAGGGVVAGAETLGRGFDRLTGRQERARGSQTDAYFREVVDEVGNSAVDYWTANPESMGSAAKALNVGTNVVGVLPQMFGMPGVFLGSAGLDPAIDLQRKDVDAGTAATVGGINLLVNAVGMRVPAAFGSTLPTRVATGAGSNLGMGVAADAASGAVLDAGGYETQAEGFNPSDPYARGLDLLLGAAFGWRAHVDAGVQATPAQRDAVLTVNNNDHARRRTLPGEPSTPDAPVVHAKALSAAIEQALRGEPVNVAGMIRPDDFVLRPEVFAPDLGPRLPIDTTSVQKDFRAIAQRHDATITSMVRPVITRGAGERSQHPHGTAADFRTKDKTPEQVEALMADLRAAGFEVIDERNTDQPHIHAELPPGGRRAQNIANAAKETSDAGVALRQRLVDDPEQLARDYAQLEDSNGGTVLNTDTARELSPEYLSDRTRSADVHEAASDTVKTLYEAKLAKPTPEGFDRKVLFTAGGTGAGKTSAIKAAGDALGRPEIVYDTNMNTLSSAVDKIEQALQAGREVAITYVYRDPVDALTAGAIPRAQRQAEKFGTGRTVPLGEHAKTHAGVRPVMEALAERYAGDERVQILAIDNSRGRGKQEVVDLASLPRVEEDSLRERLQAALEEARQGGLDERLYRGFAQEGRPATASRVGAERSPGDGGRPAQGDGREVSALETPVQAAQRVAAETPDFPVLDGFDADGQPRYRLMSEALAEIQLEHQQAVNDAQAFPAAINCALRRGFA